MADHNTPNNKDGQRDSVSSNSHKKKTTNEKTSVGESRHQQASNYADNNAENMVDKAVGDDSSKKNKSQGEPIFGTDSKALAISDQDKPSMAQSYSAIPDDNKPTMVQSYSTISKQEKVDDPHVFKMARNGSFVSLGKTDSKSNLNSEYDSAPTPDVITALSIKNNSDYDLHSQGSCKTAISSTPRRPRRAVSVKSSNCGFPPHTNPNRKHQKRLDTPYSFKTSTTPQFDLQACTTPQFDLQTCTTPQYGNSSQPWITPQYKSESSGCTTPRYQSKSPRCTPQNGKRSPACTTPQYGNRSPACTTPQYARQAHSPSVRRGGSLLSSACSTPEYGCNAITNSRCISNSRPTTSNSRNKITSSICTTLNHGNGPRTPRRGKRISSLDKLDLNYTPRTSDCSTASPRISPKVSKQSMQRIEKEIVDNSLPINKTSSLPDITTDEPANADIYLPSGIVINNYEQTTTGKGCFPYPHQIHFNEEKEKFNKSETTRYPVAQTIESGLEYVQVDETDKSVPPSRIKGCAFVDSQSKFSPLELKAMDNANCAKSFEAERNSWKDIKKKGSNVCTGHLSNRTFSMESLTSPMATTARSISSEKIVPVYLKPSSSNVQKTPPGLNDDSEKQLVLKDSRSAISPNANEDLCITMADRKGNQISISLSILLKSFQGDNGPMMATSITLDGKTIWWGKLEY